MKNIRQIAAILCALMLAFTLAACSSSPAAPETYNIEACSVTIDSFTKVVGDRTFVSSTDHKNADGKLDSLTLQYSGVTSALQDLSVYAQYLSTQGFNDYFGISGTLMSMALRQGDGALVVYSDTDSDTLNLYVVWYDTLELNFDETQYVSTASSMAFLQSNEDISFTYPILNEPIANADAVNQLILDGVNNLVQYAKDAAAGSKLVLSGSYTMDRNYMSEIDVTLTAQITMGEITQSISTTATITDVSGTPVAQYSDISVQ